MKYELAKTKNVRNFYAVMGDLLNRPCGVEGMGILWGEPGEGKSTVVAHAANQMNGICIRARRSWTMTSLLESIVTELNGIPARRRSVMENWIEKRLMEDKEQRIIFVDEADYLFNSRDMLDVLRDIYDQTGTPIVLIGMEHIARRIQENGRLARRITSWVEFKGIDFEDARVVADTLCEVHVSDDLVEHLHKEAKANIGRIVVGLSRIERVGLASGVEIISLSDWKDRPLFFDQPNFRKRRGL